jgi:hypothetical protein
MAILEQGLIGTFTGKMGSLVVSRWKNKYVGKAKPKASSKPGSDIQLDYRSKFTLMGKFLRRFTELIPVGYQNPQVGTTKINDAMSYNLLNSISGVYPNYKVNYANIKLSEPGFKGDIDGVESFVLTALPQSKLKFTWKSPAVFNSKRTQDTDLAYVVFYHADKMITIDPPHPLRSKLELDISLPRMFLGEVHGWVFFGSADRKFVSHTQYLGKVIVIE